jgi:hypothetical protein
MQVLLLGKSLSAALQVMMAAAFSSGKLLAPAALWLLYTIRHCHSPRW